MLTITPDETITLRAQVAQLHKPHDDFLAVYKDFLGGHGIKDGKSSPMDLLFGHAKNFLSDPSDLIALQKPLNYDFLSRTLRRNWFFKKKKPDDQLDRALLHEDKTVTLCSGAEHAPCWDTTCWRDS